MRRGEKKMGRYAVHRAVSRAVRHAVHYAVFQAVSCAISKEQKNRANAETDLQKEKGENCKEDKS